MEIHVELFRTSHKHIGRETSPTHDDKGMTATPILLIGGDNSTIGVETATVAVADGANDAAATADAVDAASPTFQFYAQVRIILQGDTSC